MAALGTSFAQPAAPLDSTILQEELNHCKAQYEHLAAELHDFQETSRELEAELERDAEAADEREKHYKEKIELLSYEVEESKVCVNSLPSEFNSVRNLLGNANAALSIEFSRQSTELPRPKRSPHRARCIRRSPRFVMHSMPRSSSFGIWKLQMMTTSGRPATRRRP